MLFLFTSLKNEQTDRHTGPLTISLVRLATQSRIAYYDDMNSGNLQVTVTKANARLYVIVARLHHVGYCYGEIHCVP